MPKISDAKISKAIPENWAGFAVTADPEMHAISAVTLHPSTKYWCGQSMDNQSEWARELVILWLGSRKGGTHS